MTPQFVNEYVFFWNFIIGLEVKTSKILCKSNILEQNDNSLYCCSTSLFSTERIIQN